MAELTRRSFLGATSAGVATLGLVSLMEPRTAAPASASPASMEGSAQAFDDTLMLHVRNTATGEVALLAGSREVIFHDRELVERLIRAARAASV